MEIKNFTPHEVNIFTSECVKFASVGSVRLSQNTEAVGNINFGKDLIRITKTMFGKTIGLPERKKDTIYIVSNLVCQANPDRDDFYIPNESVRDKKGRIIGCKSLSQNPYKR